MDSGINTGWKVSHIKRIIIFISISSRHLQKKNTKKVKKLAFFFISLREFCILYMKAAEKAATN